MTIEKKLNLTRRDLLQGASAASAAALLAACGNPDNNTNPGDLAVPPDMTMLMSADVATLNALLSAEYHAIKAYDAGAAILGNPPMGDPAASLAPTALAVAVHFQSQHKDHATALKAAVTAGGGTPIDEATVTFTPPGTFTAGVVNVLKLACNAERAASVAYNQTIAQLSATDNRFLAAAIQGDETQHFVALYLLIRGEVTLTGAAVPADVAATSFVAAVSGFTGLEGVADFTYA